MFAGVQTFPATSLTIAGYSEQFMMRLIHPFQTICRALLVELL
jgi:hypothetical protein